VRPRTTMALAVLAALTTVDAAGAERRTVSLYDCHRAVAPPTIDGRLSDPCWQGVPSIYPMVLRAGPGRIAAKVQTHTKVVYDDQAVYIGMRLDEPNPKGLRASMRDYDGQLWWDDSVEIYIEPGYTHQRYFKLMSTPLGTKRDTRGELTPLGMQLLDWGIGAEWTVKAWVGADRWELEFRLPYTDLETQPPKPGDVWSFEVVRFRYADPSGKHEYSSWDVGAFHRSPDTFGYIVFDGPVTAFERMVADKLRPAMGGAIRIYGREGELTFTAYASHLVPQRIGRAERLLHDLETGFKQHGGAFPDAAARAIRARLAKARARLQHLKGEAPNSLTGEVADHITDDLRGVQWSLKFQALNAQVQPADQAGH